MKRMEVLSEHADILKLLDKYQLAMQIEYFNQTGFPYRGPHWVNFNQGSFRVEVRVDVKTLQPYKAWIYGPFVHNRPRYINSWLSLDEALSFLHQNLPEAPGCPFA